MPWATRLWLACGVLAYIPLGNGFLPIITSKLPTPTTAATTTTTVTTPLNKRAFPLASQPRTRRKQDGILARGQDEGQQLEEEQPPWLSEMREGWIAEQEKEYDRKSVQVLIQAFYRALNDRNEALLREIWLRDPDTLLAPGGEETFKG